MPRGRPPGATQREPPAGATSVEDPAASYLADALESDMADRIWRIPAPRRSVARRRAQARLAAAAAEAE